MQKIVTYLWFDDQAEEAARFYTSIFKDSRIKGDMRDQTGLATEKGKVLIVEFQLEGQDFIAVNGGPKFKFTEAISLFVNCDDQREVDELWSKLTADGGEESRCGWVKDKFGLSWQIIPRRLMDLMSDKDPERARRATQAMLEMRKIDIAALERAAEAGG